MNRFKLILLSGLLLLATGCGSPMVGSWKAENFKPANPDLPSPGTLKLDINKDGTFIAVYEPKDGTKRGASGDWDQDAGNRIRLFTRTGDGPKATSAQLSGKTLTLVGEGFAAEMKRD